MGWVRTGLGLLATALYFWWVGSLLLPRYSEFQALELNALGDFFAGVFGPVAFLWLVIGYFQQGAELKQNNEALKLQAEELRNAVEQQRKLVGVTTRQVEQDIERARIAADQRRHAIMPKFVLESKFARGGGLYTLEFYFQNRGGKITDISFSFAGDLVGLNRNLAVLDSGEKAVFVYPFPQGKEPQPSILNIRYLDGDGGSGVSAFSMLVIWKNGTPHMAAEQILRSGV